MSDDTEPATRRDTGRVPTYTSWLRGLSDAALDGLLETRPDLAAPVPAGFTELAARAASRRSVLCALDRLDRFSLQVAEALLALGDPLGSGPPLGTDRAALAAALDLPESALAPALTRLRTAALVWTDGAVLRPVAVLRDLLDQPAGLGPPLAALLFGHPLDRLNRLAADLGLSTGYADGEPAARITAELTRPGRLDGLLAAAGAPARTVLDRLLWGPPHGSVANARRSVSLASAASPIDRLLALGLLVATDDTTITLPREVALHLRGGRVFPKVEAAAPVLSAVARPAVSVARAAAGQVFTVLRAVEELLTAWADDPPGALRNGGLGVRDLRAAARLLDTDERGAAVLLETVHAAGLLGCDGGGGAEWLPTAEYDAWLAEEPARRWLRLASAWQRSPRVAGRCVAQDARGRSRSVLGEGLDHRWAPEVRHDVLAALAELPAGHAPSAESLVERLGWLRPRRHGPVVAELVRHTLDDAAVLGVTGRGALAPYAHALLADPGSASASAALALLAAELPEPVDHILVQSDLTAVAPGPLVAPLARELALLADVESTGGATVYRFGEASVRRALDAGRGADEILALLERHSATPLPQPLRYLVADVARRHGRLRAGAASSYLRCDDPALLGRLLGDRRAADLMLFPLAPTVVASRVSRPVLLDRLSALGYHPVAEAVDGSVQSTRPPVRRAAGVPADAHLAGPRPLGPRQRAAAVRAIRAGEARGPGGEEPRPRS